MKSLKELLGLKNLAPDIVMPTGNLYKHIPWNAPQAYLHTLFNPVDLALLAMATEVLSIPPEWQLFLQRQNGATIYFRSLSFYGLREPGQLLDRRSGTRVPFDLKDANSEARFPAGDEWLVIASYGHFGSNVLLSRRSGSVQVVTRSGDSVLATWANLEDWVTSDLQRLSILFSPEGRLLTDGSFTDPAYQPNLSRTNH